MVYDRTTMNLEDNYLLMSIPTILGLLYDVSVYGKEQKKFFFFFKGSNPPFLHSYFGKIILLISMNSNLCYILPSYRLHVYNRKWVEIRSK